MAKTKYRITPADVEAVRAAGLGDLAERLYTLIPRSVRHFEPPPDSRACTYCGVVKPLAEFSPSPTGRWGYEARCKECNCLRQRERRYAGAVPHRPRTKVSDTSPDYWKPRFWAKVNKTKTCWLWTGALDSSGYGTSAPALYEARAHRISYTDAHGPIPKGMHIDHLCRVRSCVNPAHLECVTPRENILRGHGVAGTHARRTHCVHGHEFTPENTMRLKGETARTCVTCYKSRYARRAGAT